MGRGKGNHLAYKPLDSKQVLRKHIFKDPSERFAGSVISRGVLQAAFSDFSTGKTEKMMELMIENKDELLNKPNDVFLQELKKTLKKEYKNQWEELLKSEDLKTKPASLPEEYLDTWIENSIQAPNKYLNGYWQSKQEGVLGYQLALSKSNPDWFKEIIDLEIKNNGKEDSDENSAFIKLLQANIEDKICGQENFFNQFLEMFFLEKKNQCQAEKQNLEEIQTLLNTQIDYSINGKEACLQIAKEMRIDFERHFQVLHEDRTRKTIKEKFQSQSNYHEKAVEYKLIDLLSEELLPGDKETLEKQDIENVLNAFFHMFELKKRGKIQKALHETNIAANHQAILEDIKNSSLSYSEFKDHTNWAISMFFYSKRAQGDPANQTKENSKNNSTILKIKKSLNSFKQNKQQTRNSAAEMMRSIFLQRMIDSAQVSISDEKIYREIKAIRIYHD